MALETGTYISDLVATNPAASDAKSQGDDHLRLLKSTLKATFPNVTGAVTPSHTLLNTIGVTQSPGDSSTKTATTAFVAATAFSSSLPAQTGNAGKFISTNGTSAIWTDTFAGQTNQATGEAIASAATVNLDTVTGNRLHITGTTTITAVTLTRGPRTVIFDGVLTLTHHATNNNLPGAANITTAAGDRAIYESDGTTVYCVSYIKASGAAVVSAPSPFTAYFQSADQTITASGALTLAHGLGASPKLIQAFLKNVTAQHGYSTGDVIPISFFVSASDERGVGANVDAANIYIIFGMSATTLTVSNKTNGASSFITNANWKFFVRAAA